jgi:hypothetical protein
MRAYLTHVLWRTLFVLSLLVAGLLGWPGITGADGSLLNSGSIDVSGARRITVTPSNAPAAAGGGFGGLLSRLMGAMGGDGPKDMETALTGTPDVSLLPDMSQLPDGMLDALRDLPEGLSLVDQERDQALARARDFGQMISQIDGAQGQVAKARRLTVDAAKTGRAPTPGEVLFTEFGEAQPARTPYEASRAAMEARR